MRSSAHQYPVNILDPQVFCFGVAACHHNILLTISLIISSQDVKNSKKKKKRQPGCISISYGAVTCMCLILFIVGALGLSRFGACSYIWIIVLTVNLSL